MRGDVYRRAAKGLHELPVQASTGMCAAVFGFGGGMFEQTDALDVFTPDSVVTPYWGRQWSDDLAERRECRVLALCFAAAMADEGDL